ncbi:unnamed protein product [Notodromas monacha]|uniref:Protein white n=1 Tax=Notodromas monacha TaxID=399045 RepID=A0A7R9BUE5_9CRUS|nr:unnamed protein product [Notodromas monacha]CAG0920875.1 unnamed protein product [Notodromas monacha]
MDSSLETDVDSLASERSSDDTGIGIIGRGSALMTDGLFDHRADVTVTWENINVYANDPTNGAPDLARRPTSSKHIIKGVSGTVRPGELLAIMGASGAGKTTLLNALTCRTKSSTAVSGVIRLNGAPAGANALTAVSAYVTQHDLFMPNLTVREHLQFQATVRIPSAAMSADTKMARVEDVIAEATSAYPAENGDVLPSHLSGAGKTTLLNALTCRTKSSTAVSGVIRLNGAPAGANALTAVSAYVTQHDLFMPNLTVREHLQFQATVRIPSAAMSADTKMARVEDVIAELGLVKCANNLIGIVGGDFGISGGERRRLAFASEVLTNPAVLFCDEPTSGLDSYMAGTVVGVLRSMASRGRTILATIHQPSSLVYSLFDRVMFLAEGRVGFLGNTDTALAFFSDLGYPCPENHNPADFFIQTLAVRPGDEDASRSRIRKICDAFARAHDVIVAASSKAGEYATLTKMDDDDDDDVDGASINNADINGKKRFFGSAFSSSKNKRSAAKDTESRKHVAAAGTLSPYRVPWTAQCKALLWRSWLTMIREPIIIKVRVLETIVFCSEYPIFLKEHEAGMYRVTVYFACKSLAELPLFIVSPLIFSTCVYFLIGLTSGVKNFLTTCGVAVLVANAACSFGYMISCISSNMHMGLAVGPAVIVPFMLLGGYYLNNGSVPKALLWLKYLSWFLYGNEALAINQWSNVGHIDCSHRLLDDVIPSEYTNFTIPPHPYGPPNIPVTPDINSVCPKDGKAVLASFSFNPDNMATDILSLLALIVGFRLVGLVALMLRTRHRSGTRL